METQELDQPGARIYLNDNIGKCRNLDYCTYKMVKCSDIINYNITNYINYTSLLSFLSITIDISYINININNGSGNITAVYIQ